jgi:hypothetical protein
MDRTERLTSKGQSDMNTTMADAAGDDYVVLSRSEYQRLLACDQAYVSRRCTFLPGFSTLGLWTTTNSD